MHYLGIMALVIMDADNADLKRSFIPYIKREITTPNFS
jgi:hypothetical protein